MSDTLLVYPMRNTNTRKLQINSSYDRKCMNIKGYVKTTLSITHELIYKNYCRRLTLT